MGRTYTLDDVFKNIFGHFSIVVELPGGDFYITSEDRMEVVQSANKLIRRSQEEDID